MAHRLWLLNPDAEQEMLQFFLRKATTVKPAEGEPGEPRAKIPSRGLSQKAWQLLTDRFLSLTCGEPTLFLRSGELLPPREEKIAKRQWIPWCPTTGVQAYLHRATGQDYRGPSMTLLCDLNDKLYLQRHSEHVAPGRRLITTFEELVEVFETGVWPNRSRTSRTVAEGGPAAVRLKRRFGQAGRGQRRVNVALSEDDRRFIIDSMGKGGLIAEPELDVRENLSLHGLVHPAGLMFGTPYRFRVDRFSAPRGPETRPLSPRDRRRDDVLTRNELALAVASDVESSMLRIGTSVGSDLKARGYSGPFGLDFVETKDHGLVLLDLNARFTINWSLGMNERRDEALSLMPRYQSD